MNKELPLYNQVSLHCSKIFTRSYSTSFSLASSMLAPETRRGIYSIYGFVRIADEIVDSFHDFDKENLLNKYSQDLNDALKNGISTNPILNSFQLTVNQYNIEGDLIEAFLKSMRADLNKQSYDNVKDYEEYIYGSADVVGLMCLKVFVKGDEDQYQKLKEPAMKLGSAFQKVNFLRDIQNDYEKLNRRYFPGVNLHAFTNEDKRKIIDEIRNDFRQSREGIKKLPANSRLAVYVAYVYYQNLLKRLNRTHPSQIMSKRIRVPGFIKLFILAQSWLRFRINLI